MQSIYEKLNVKNRSELSIKMMEKMFNISLDINDISDINKKLKIGNIEPKEINATLSIEIGGEKKEQMVRFVFGDSK